MAVRNALVLGGTGMLSGVAVNLLAEHYNVFVVGRNSARFAALQQAAGERLDYLTMMAMDYHDADRLGRWVAHIQLMHGPMDVVVAWIHGDAMPVLEVVDREVAAYRQSAWDLYHVQGIRGAHEPSQPLDIGRQCRYHRVILGYVPTPDGSRWLTHDEISQGVSKAIAASSDAVVGRVDPYEGRPQ